MSVEEDKFLYQINFNRKKFPEICQALEEAKADNGIAFYLRTLIQRDIDSKKGIVRETTETAQVVAPPKKVEEKTTVEEVTTNKVDQHEPEEIETKVEVKDELPDDSGGFC
ncbi:hypothetical protein [Bacillus wiedmannii]|uniref:hypothetical protein n=1 Tax=Bacillus wiedmannii TaxID=1890302 RepID=UPI000BF222FD|nr:hypothetical protein [Bacillus wiedmannii]PEN61587.1 hypothetical protein CN576_21365 [Bacillus wiedmannii]PHA62833.1 hypothetical protein COE75_16470 [Bacillus wiedmannii]